MNNVWPLDSDEWDDSVDVGVFIPGPPGPPLLDFDTRAIPALISGTISAPMARRQRSFIAGNLAPVVDPAIPNPSDNGAWEIFLFSTSAVNTITLNNQPNLQLSGQWVGGDGSILYLQWDGVSKYVEGGRNEI